MPDRRPYTPPDRSILPALAGHAAMGVVLGLGLSLALIFVDTFGMTALIAHGVGPRHTMIVLVGMFTLAFGVGATLSGFVLLMIEER